jgi:predicted glycosyltransferase
VIPYSAWTGYGIARNNIWRYRALDPVAWLRHSEKQEDRIEGKTILLRLEESKASYIADNNLESKKMIDDLVNELSDSMRIIILCRYQDQIAEIEARYGKKVNVLKDIVDGTSLIRSALLFVGAGGTMTAEAALLGKPTISIAPIQYSVEQYLMRIGLVKKAADSKTLVKLCKRLISDQKYQQAQKKKAKDLLAGMEDPTDRMISAIMS